MSVSLCTFNLSSRPGLTTPGTRLLQQTLNTVQPVPPAYLLHRPAASQSRARVVLACVCSVHSQPSIAYLLASIVLDILDIHSCATRRHFPSTNQARALNLHGASSR